MNCEVPYMTKVAVVKADSYDTQVVEQAMAELLTHLGGIEKFIQLGDRVLIKKTWGQGCCFGLLRISVIKVSDDNLRQIVRHQFGMNAEVCREMRKKQVLYIGSHERN